MSSSLSSVADGRVKKRNAHHAKADQQFATEDARVKLKGLWAPV
jgi:hypothetical protein